MEKWRNGKINVSIFQCFNLSMFQSFNVSIIKSAFWADFSFIRNSTIIKRNKEDVYDSKTLGKIMA